MDDFEITGETPAQQLMVQLFNSLNLTRVSTEKILQRRIDGLRDLSIGEYLSYVHSMVMVDFSFWIKGCSYPIHIDVKDKRQFVPENWDIQQDEKNDWAILDETSIKKILNIGFTSFVVIQDIPNKVVYLWNSQSLGLSLRKWALREDTGGGIRKYKLLYHTSGAEKHTNLGSLILSMIRWVNSQAYELSHSGASHTWFNPKVENCVINRQQRTPQHKATDLIQSGLDRVSPK